MQIDPGPNLLGLIGFPVSQSYSAMIHNCAFSKLHLPYVYRLLETPPSALESTLTALRQLRFHGFNVTMPYKEQILPFLDEVRGSASLVQSVNTVVREQGRWIGYSTDGAGYLRSLRAQGINISRSRFILVGAGGAAKSIAVELAAARAAEIFLLNRDPSKAFSLLELLNRHFSELSLRADTLSAASLDVALETADVLIDATSLGMDPHQSLVDSPQRLPASLLVCDLLYNPPRSKLLQQAQARGCPTLNGLGMLLGQAAIAFELWTQQQMPVEFVAQRLFSSCLEDRRAPSD